MPLNQYSNRIHYLIEYFVSLQEYLELYESKFYFRNHVNVSSV